MKRWILGLGLLFLVADSAAFAAQNSAIVRIASIESRESGYHGLYLDVATPDEGCTLTDRGIMVETGSEAEPLLQTALAALTSNRRVRVRVDGCVIIEPEQPQITAPRVTKILILCEPFPTCLGLSASMTEDARTDQ